ncbi:MAG: SsrA-binding protein SmpB [Desulfovibrionaceae bacterium]|nr:SsrA-binding protein SmpB [Desulfovibrionaceae bacterium]
MSEKKAKKAANEIAVNKKARFLYELSDFIEAGLVLTGPEVKSMRAHKVNFVDSYVEFRHGEAWLVSLHVAPYVNAGYTPQDPDRDRKLLLHPAEIKRLSAAVAQKGITVVPVKLYFARGKVKVEIAQGKGKKLHDQRETLKKRAEERDLQRELV